MELEFEIVSGPAVDMDGADEDGGGGDWGALKENSCRWVQCQGPMAY